MLTTLLLTAVALLLAFELLEHVILPLWSLGRRMQRRPLSGLERMVGRRVTVRTWEGGGGLVAIDGELWRGVCEAPLGPGDEAVIRAVRGLTLELELPAGAGKAPVRATQDGAPPEAPAGPGPGSGVTGPGS